jgi:hypothetical protein
MKRSSAAQIAVRLLFARRHQAVASVNTNTAAIITAASTKTLFQGVRFAVLDKH